MFVPPRPSQPSPQVSLNGSPARGTVWNSQSFAPVRTSNARGLPAGPWGTSPLAAPMIATFSKIVGVPPYAMPTSTAPFVPNPAAGVPVAASGAIKVARLMKRMRGGAVPSPGQKLTPRVDAVGPLPPPGPPPPPGPGGRAAPSGAGGGAGNTYSHTSEPVSPSRATTRSRLGKYMTPPTTIGT